MKSYTSPVVCKEPKKKGLFARLFGNRAATYYEAQHKEESVYALWIESGMFGRLRCFPCVLDEAGDFLVYEPIKAPETMEENRTLIQRWPLFLTKQTAEEYRIRELEHEQFNEIYQKYRKKKVNNEFAKLGMDNAPEQASEQEALNAPQAEPAQDALATENGEVPQQ